MKERTRLSLLAVTAVLGALCAAAAVSWACVPSATLSIDTQPGQNPSGPVGSVQRARGAGFPDDGPEATVKWMNNDGSNPQSLVPIGNAPGDDTIPVSTAPFSFDFRVPNAPPGVYLVEVRVAHGPNGFQAATFTIPSNDPAGGNVTYPIPNPFGGGGGSSTPGTASGPTGSCQGRANTRVGTSGRDVINGTSGADVISGRGGNDVIRGRGGADRICGNGGRDSLSGGSGGDRLSGSSGNDKLSGNSGRDRLTGGSGRDRLSGGGGRDRLSGGGGKDRLNGGGGRDLCLAGSGDGATRNCE